MCRVVGGSTPASGVAEFWNGEIVWITPTDLGDLTQAFVDSSARRISRLGYESCGTELVPVGSVILSSRAPIGHLAVASVPLCTNQGCKSFVPSDAVDSLFLYFALKQRVPELQSLGSGATFKEVSKGTLESFSISVPPKAEQRRIAAILRERMDAVERARNAAEAQLEAAFTLFSAKLRAAFQGITPLSVDSNRDAPPPRWKWALLTSLATLQSGHTPSRYHPEYWSGDIPWLALADIRKHDGLYVEDTQEYTNDLGLANSSARLLPEYTVVLSRTATVGFTSIMRRPMATSQDFVNWVCGPSIHPEFLMQLFQAARLHIRSLASGAVHKTIYMPTVRAFEVCVPRLDEQIALATRLAEAHVKIDRLRVTIRSQLDDIECLPTSLLRAAFSGEL